MTDQVTAPAAAPQAGIPVVNPLGAAPVAPPQAPPAAPAPAEPEGKGKKAAPEPYNYGETGDVSMDMALGFIGRLGYRPDHPAVQQALNGNFDIIRAELATRDDARGYEAYVALGEKAYQAQLEKTKGQQAAVEQAVLSAVGGAERYQEIQAWAKQNADPHEREQINAMFDAGPVAAKAAAIYLMNCYQNATGTVVEPASAVRPGAARQPAAASNGPLSPEQYKQELRALVQKIGASRVDGSPEYAKLQQRRLAFRG